jgi:hypothetical protein
LPPYKEIRADFDRETLVVYQAYRPAIAEPALKAGRFVPPFSLERMTWIKPSFLWMMERSNWGRKTGQEYILAIRIRRSCWDSALAEAQLTDHGDRPDCRVLVQWDPERSIRGEKLQHRSIQVGLSRFIIAEYVSQWITEIRDMTPQVARMRGLLDQGDVARAKRLLPPEKVYPAPAGLRIL